MKAFVLLDGTLLPIDRIAAGSPPLPGAVHDIRAAREHGIIDAPVCPVGIRARPAELSGIDDPAASTNNRGCR